MTTPVAVYSERSKHMEIELPCCNESYHTWDDSEIWEVLEEDCECQICGKTWIVADYDDDMEMTIHLKEG